MKRNLLLIILGCTSWYYCKAQWLPMNPIENLNYSNTYARSKQILIHDSLIYTLRGGGIEILNTNTHATDYLWAGYYPVNNIVADTGNTIVFLKNSNFIGKFDGNTNRYENIWPDSLSSVHLSDIDISSDGKVWAVTWNGTHEVAVYNGIAWSFYPNLYNYYGFSGVKVINDTSAYVVGNRTIYRFHEGIYDSLYTIQYPAAYDFKDWDADQAGNIWFAVSDTLIHIYEGTVTYFDGSNTPLGNDQFLHVMIGANNHVWTAGNTNNIMEYDGAIWHLKSLQSNSAIENFTLDSQNYPWVIAKNNTPQLNKFDGVNWSVIEFPFMPLRNVKAVGLSGGYGSPEEYFANNEGIFRTDGFNNLNDFNDSSSVSHADDVICFSDNNPGYNPVFGSHSGIGNLYDFLNSELPSSKVNHICYYNNTYYIATDSGLLAYNGILYNVINSSNSPLPSDKITYVSAGNSNYCSNANALFVGTDKGIAIYQNAEWKVYDSTTIPVNNFYVTGAMPACFDTAIYVSTLGSGLIKLYPHGGYDMLNTSNGQLLDDSLYYIFEAQLGDCGEYVLMGTGHHGIAYAITYYQQLNFDYDTLFNYNGNIKIHSSKTAAMSQSNSYCLVGTDSLVYLLMFCGAVNQEPQPKELKWYQQDNDLTITVPEKFFGDGNILLMDMLGKTVIERDCDTRSGNIKMDISNLTSGIYIFRLSVGNKTGFSKVAISRN